MAVSRTHTTVWLTKAPRERALRRAEPRARNVFVRVFGLSAAAAGVLTLGVSSVPPAPPARADVAPERASTLKAVARIESWNGPLAPLQHSVPAPASTWSLFGPDPSATFARFAPAPQSSRPAQLAVSPEWQEREFAGAAVVDGRTLEADGVRIRLSGLALPGADEACRTLDGRVEACATRAATQLELITRHRKVTCRYQAQSSGEAAGTCRVGSSDLGERLLKTGYLRRLDAADGSPSGKRLI